MEPRDHEWLESVLFKRGWDSTRAGSPQLARQASTAECPGAIKRLENTGIQPYPGIKESVGIANGRGDNPTWMFEVQASSAEINEFYRTTENTGDWSFQGDVGIHLRFRRNDQVLKIAFRDGHSSGILIYIIEESQTARF